MNISMVMIFVGLRYGGAEQRDRNNNHPNPSDKNGAMEISFGYTSDGYRNKRVCNQEVPRSSERTSDGYRNKRVGNQTKPVVRSVSECCENENENDTDTDTDNDIY